jgi:hypothetical protein
MQHIFSYEGLERVDLQKLNIIWQTSGFLVWDNCVGSGVLVKQGFCVTVGKIILRIEVQFPTSYYSSRNVLLG